MANVIPTSIGLVLHVRCRSFVVELADYRAAIKGDLPASTDLPSIAPPLKNLPHLDRIPRQRLGQCVVHCRALGHGLGKQPGGRSSLLPEASIASRARRRSVPF